MLSEAKFRVVFKSPLFLMFYELPGVTWKINVIVHIYAIQ